LTRAAETITDEDSGAPLCRHIAELEGDKSTLQHALDHSIKDYNALVMGNKSLLSEHNKLKCCCEDLQAALASVVSEAKKRVDDLEAKVKTMKAHDEKHLRDFEDGLVRKLEELRGLYAGNVQIIEGLCSHMPMEEPSAEDYLCWLSKEVFSLPDMFSGVNEVFATVAIEGALAMAGDLVDLDAIRGA
jgi:hypothetical protein